MKIIDLLNKIANGEEIPKYIKYYDILHQKEDTMMCCYNNIIYKLDNNIIDLLDEVEILEEEKKIPEKIKTLKHSCNFDRHEEILYENQVDLANKITEILDYLKSKGE